MVAIVVFLFLSGRTIATSMRVVSPGTIGPAPEGLERSGRRPATAFLNRDAKPKAAEKSWRRMLRETSEAKPIFGQTHAHRDRGWSARFRKSGNTAMAAVPAPQRSRTEAVRVSVADALPPDLHRHGPVIAPAECTAARPSFRPSLV
jgi:hypothetical protein